MQMGILVSLTKVERRMNLHDYMAQLRQEIDQYLILLIKTSTDAPVLNEAMLYSVENGGKRIRPVLLLMMLEAFGIDHKNGMVAACALEMIHTYSLIHDDLPAMDNDDLRRGKPTNHKVYGEAVAILAGDGLLTDAFLALVEDDNLSADIRVKLVRALSMLAGSSTGMIAGQVLDIDAEKNPVELNTLKRIHHLKTGRLIEFACLAAGMIAKQNDEIMASLSEYAHHLGLAFQIQDDILDIEGDTDKIGKPVGSDVANNKSTYVSLLGLVGAKEMLASEIEAALAVLVKLPADTKLLKQLTLYVANRDS